jgi:hypothetical protein
MQRIYGIGLVTEFTVKALEGLPLMTLTQAKVCLQKLKDMTQDSNPHLVVINRKAL